MAKLLDGKLVLPAGTDIPDGIEFTITLPLDFSTPVDRQPPPPLPVFHGNGFKIDLEDKLAVRRILDEDKPSQIL